MDKEIKQRQDVILSKYPSVNIGFESMCATRYGEIIDELLKSDETYKKINSATNRNQPSCLENYERVRHD
jgi:hypothetical protein